jgi:hypothetical protein
VNVNGKNDSAVPIGFKRPPIWRELIIDVSGLEIYVSIFQALRRPHRRRIYLQIRVADKCCRHFLFVDQPSLAARLGIRIRVMAEMAVIEDG